MWSQNLALKKDKFSIPPNVPAKWIVDCSRAGKGITALKYLSKYLYRGVISENNIISNKNGMVTFKYIESKTKKNTIQNSQRRRFLTLDNAACPTKRISKNKRLWVSSW